jgi:hypothetical protein
MLSKFPYVYAEVERFGRLFYPVITLDVETIFGWKKFDFLVDTGADATTFPATILPYLGIEKTKLKKSKTLGVGGISVITYDAKIKIKILDKIVNIESSITFDRGTPFLLGRKDIFEEKFNLTLDSKNKQTIISEN